MLAAAAAPRAAGLAELVANRDTLADTHSGGNAFDVHVRQRQARVRALELDRERVRASVAIRPRRFDDPARGRRHDVEAVGNRAKVLAAMVVKQVVGHERVPCVLVRAAAPTEPVDREAKRGTPGFARRHAGEAHAPGHVHKRQILRRAGPVARGFDVEAQTADLARQLVRAAQQRRRLAVDLDRHLGAHDDGAGLVVGDPPVGLRELPDSDKPHGPQSPALPRHIDRLPLVELENRRPPRLLAEDPGPFGQGLRGIKGWDHRQEEEFRVQGSGKIFVASFVASFVDPIFTARNRHISATPPPRPNDLRCSRTLTRTRLRLR